MSYFVSECERGDFGRDTRAVVDQRDNASVEALVDATTVLIVLFPAFTQPARCLCAHQLPLFLEVFEFHYNSRG